MGNSVSLRLVQKKNRPERFSLIATNDCIILAVRWFVKWFFTPNSPRFWKKCGKEAEEDGEWQFQNAIRFSQGVQGLQAFAFSVASDLFLTITVIVNDEPTEPRFK